MDYEFNEQQQMLKKSARDFLTTNCPPSLVKEMEEDEKGYSSVLWQQIAELGWTGLIVPEKYGGSDGDFLDLMVLIEEMGRALTPVPFFSTVILGGLVLIEAGDEAQKQNYLPRLVDGNLILSLALTEPEGGWSPASIRMPATTDKDDYILDGTKLFIENANMADYLICAARTSDSIEGGISLFLVDAKDPNIKYTLLKTIAKDKQYEVVFDKVKVPKQNVIGEIGNGWSVLEKVLAKAAIAKSIEMVGGMQQSLEMTTEYAKQRVQFERPIGSFQAVQHHCANMLIATEGSRWLAYKTAWLASEGFPYLKEAYMTKAWVSDAYQQVARLGVQVHGGLGIMKEHEMQLYFRRAKSAEVILGDPDFYREKVAVELFDL